MVVTLIGYVYVRAFIMTSSTFQNEWSIKTEGMMRWGSFQNTMSSDEAKNTYVTYYFLAFTDYRLSGILRGSPVIRRFFWAAGAV